MVSETRVFLLRKPERNLSFSRTRACWVSCKPRCLMLLQNDLFYRCRACSDACFVAKHRQERWRARVASPQQRDLAGDAGMGQRRLQRWRQTPGCDPQVQTYGEAFVRLWSGALTFFLYGSPRVIQLAFPYFSLTICVIFSRGHTHVRCCLVCPRRGACSTKKWSRPCTNTGMFYFSSFPCFRAYICIVTFICTDLTAPIRSSCPCPTPLPR